MVETLIQPMSVLSGVMVFVATALSIVANFKNVSKKDFSQSLDLVAKELKKQKEYALHLQQQLHEKDKQIQALQTANQLEETLLENRDPQLEQTLALLAHGQATILEMLKKGGDNS
jgi:methylthioribose-1-phosphate isomerase